MTIKVREKKTLFIECETIDEAIEIIKLKNSKLIKKIQFYNIIEILNKTRYGKNILLECVIKI